MFCLVCLCVSVAGCVHKGQWHMIIITTIIILITMTVIVVIIIPVTTATRKGKQCPNQP